MTTIFNNIFRQFKNIFLKNCPIIIDCDDCVLSYETNDNSATCTVIVAKFVEIKIEINLNGSVLETSISLCSCIPLDNILTRVLHALEIQNSINVPETLRDLNANILSRLTYIKICAGSLKGFVENEHLIVELSSEGLKNAESSEEGRALVNSLSFLNSLSEFSIECRDSITKNILETDQLLINLDQKLNVAKQNAEIRNQ